MFGEVDADASGQQVGAVEVLFFAGGLVGGEHGFAHVHVGVLAAVGVDGGPVAGGDFVDVELGVRFPETAFEQVVYFGGQCLRAVDSGLDRAGGGQKDECVAVTIARAVFYFPSLQDPGEAAVGLAVALLEEAQAVGGGLPEGRLV